VLPTTYPAHDWPKGSVEQLIGDYYGSCMDGPRINKEGVGAGGTDVKQDSRDEGSTPICERMILRFS